LLLAGSSFGFTIQSGITPTFAALARSRARLLVLGQQAVPRALMADEETRRLLSAEPPTMRPWKREMDPRSEGAAEVMAVRDPRGEREALGF
jgi:hypothetical protein